MTTLTDPGLRPLTRVEAALPDWLIDVTSDAYGAIAREFDQVFDGVMSNGSDILDCDTSAPFTADMVGWPIDVLEAGASEVDYHGVTGYSNKAGIIIAYVDPTRVQLSFTASHALTAQQVTFAPDSTAAILAASAAADLIGAALYFPRGYYVFNDRIECKSGQSYYGDGKGVSIIRQIGPTRSVTTVWPASTSVVVGANYRPTVAFGDTKLNRKYRVTVAGTTGASEPTWPTVTGQTVVSGTATFIDVGMGHYDTFDIVNGTDHVRIHDLSVMGCTSVNGTALAMTGASFGIGFSTGWRLGTGGAGGDAGNADRVSDVVIRDAEFSYLWGMGQRNNGDVGDQSSANPGIWRIKVLDCDFYNNADSALNPHIGGGFEVAGCFFRGNSTAMEYGGSKIWFHHNYIESNRMGGIAIGGLGNPAEGKDNLFEFNLVLRNGGPVGSQLAGYGMQIDGNNVHVEICNNIIRENRYWGIGIGGIGPHFGELFRDINIHHNHVISNGTTSENVGFGITCGQAGVTIEDNIVFDDDIPNRTQGIGISVGNGVPNCKVRRNHSYNHAIRDYHLCGINTIFVDEYPDGVIYTGGPSDAAYSGTVDTASNIATWKSGHLFSDHMKLGSAIRINGVDYSVGSLNSPPGGTADSDDVTAVITRVTGPNFETSWVGKYIRLGGVGQIRKFFLIASVADASHLTVDTIYGAPLDYTGTSWSLRDAFDGTGSVQMGISNGAGTQTGVAYAFVPSFVFPAPITGAALPVLTEVNNRIIITHETHSMGTGNVQIIFGPVGAKPGTKFTVIPTGAYTLTAGNNVGAASTATIGRPMDFVWDGSLWWPSY